MKEPSIDLEAQSTLQASCLLSLITASSLEEIFERLTKCTGEWFDSDYVTLWWLDKESNQFSLVSSTMPPDQRKSAIGAFSHEDGLAACLLSSDESVVLSDHETYPSQVESGSSLAASIHYDKRVLGLLIVHPKQPSHSWSESERKLLRLIAKSAGELCSNIETKKALSKLVELVQEFSQTTTSHNLYDVALTQGKELLGSDHATVYRLYPKESLLLHGVSSSKRNALPPLTPGEGATGLAIERLQTIRIDDVTGPEWRGVYRSKLPSHDESDVRSELSVPIILRNCQIHIGNRSEFVNKPLGVLNFESSAVGAFSTLDERCAQVLAEYVAQAIDRIEYDSKLSKLSRASRALAFKRNWDSIIDTLLYSICESLDYEFASLSIIDPHARVIRCVRATGIPNADEFCRGYQFRLDSTHVTAKVVREHRVQVPAPDDPSQDDMSARFGLDRFIRVFVPMISASHEDVIGVISAGYDRTYRKHIYQRDVELLRMLTEFGTIAMEAVQRSGLDRISHELNAPLTAVRANLEYLRRNRRNLSDEDIDRNLEDMLTDTQILYYQIQKLEYVFAGEVAEVTKPSLHTEPVRLFSDIILKTINQLRSLVRDHGLDPKKISCSERDVHKLKPLNVDKSKISQVIFNLFMNAVKYAESPETFQIQISAEEEKDNYVIKFRDWGIGIPKEFKEKVFADRFRAPIAYERAIGGSGLGLTIARQIMREHGGDLILSNNAKPTEFQLIFPKSLRQSR